MTTAFNATSLADGIAALNTKGVKKISFAACTPKLDDEGVSELARALKKHTDVFWLGLFDQEFSLTGLDSLLSVLKFNKSLTHLDLGRNNLGDEGIQKLCDFLATNKTVIEVYLWDNHITEKGAKALQQLLRQNRYIQNMDLNDNPDVPKTAKGDIAALLKEGASRVPASPRAGPMKIN